MRILALFLILITSVFAYNATGGAITTILDGGLNYTIHTFTSNSTFNVTGQINATILCVAGGGGGGYTTPGNGGGGGAGGILYNTSYNATGNISVVVGNGGVTGSGIATNGQNSTFGNMTCVGGGYGGHWTGGESGTLGGNGGSGGGTAQSTNTQGTATGTSGQGYAGGYYIGGGVSYSGGGGGGAGGVGQNSTTTGGGWGGEGVNYSINGSSVCYGGGGGGSTHSSKAVQAGGGCQNQSGGKGARATGGQAATAGVNGTGGGGGGGGEGQQGKDGGKGIVIVRYLTDMGGTVNVTDTAPLNASYPEGNISYEMKCIGTFTDYEIDIEIDGEGNVTAEPLANDTLYSTELHTTAGHHTVVFTCANGTVSNNISTEYTVYSAPSVVLYTPLDGTENLSAVIPFGYYATSPNDAVFNCSIYINGTLNQSNGSYENGTTGQFIIQGFENGTYSYGVSCEGSLGNVGDSGENDFSVVVIGGGGSSGGGSAEALVANALISMAALGVFLFLFRMADARGDGLMASVWLSGLLLTMTYAMAAQRVGFEVTGLSELGDLAFGILDMLMYVFLALFFFAAIGAMHTLLGWVSRTVKGEPERRDGDG